VQQRGSAPGTESRAWLEQRGVIVDITADQFLEISEPVIVTTNRSWHDRFGDVKQLSGDFDRYNDHTSTTLGNAYRMVMHHMTGG
jgi:hypothetical protein